MNYRIEKKTATENSNTENRGGFHLDVPRYIAGACAMIALLLIAKYYL
ncbi:MAG TPA: hypothetical protein PKM65_08530 [Spirochaetota bacterium]|nr:hypothetical protein [Spirochaetota bacterium]HNT12526.1 hypothetical protein [Spirochaetota bacterium]HNV47375.1 hypothetical protein [Spirochaetota bacterium]HPU88605.1 hypothetical protein [Spirochaetota bacterium]